MSEFYRNTLIYFLFSRRSFWEPPFTLNSTLVWKWIMLSPYYTAHLAPCFLPGIQSKSYFQRSLQIYTSWMTFSKATVLHLYLPCRCFRSEILLFYCTLHFPNTSSFLTLFLWMLYCPIIKLCNTLDSSLPFVVTISHSKYWFILGYSLSILVDFFLFNHFYTCLLHCY